jgi:hypothetical protein
LSNNKKKFTLPGKWSYFITLLPTFLPLSLFFVLFFVSPLNLEMKIQYAVGFLISAVLTTALAEKGEEKPKLIRLPVTKRKTKALSKRDGGGTAGLYNDNMSIYLVNVAIGTPPQNFQLVLDTGR